MKLFWITLLISSLVSCHNFKEDRQLSFALERAGENRRELEQVLEHYKNDSLKYRAACFLIKNMPGHYSYCGKITNTYNKQIDSIILQTQKEGVIMIHLILPIALIESLKSTRTPHSRYKKTFV